jgi:hypothetical protein
MTPQDLQAYAIPIGIVLAALTYIFIGPMRRSLIKTFKSSHEAGRNLRDPEE